MAWASINGADIYYELHEPSDGAAQGPVETLVFAHGAGGSHLSWWQQVPYFSRAYRCLAFDQRGFGKSTAGGEAGLDTLTQDLTALLDHLHVEQAYLVGQSLGGRPCMGVTVTEPGRVKALIMADTIFGMAESEAALREHRAANEGVTLESGAYSARLRAEQPLLAFLYDEIRALNPLRNPPRVDAAAAHDSRFAGTPERLAGLDVPVLFVAGADDALVPPAIMRAAAKLIPHARYEEVAGCGHSVYFENAPAFNGLLERFLSAVERGVWDVSQMNLTPAAQSQWERLQVAGLQPFALTCSCGKSFVSPGSADGMLEELWLAEHYGREGHAVRSFEG
ncbi:MAG: alpha/beta fold hydrolase [Chloroflexota bacterium]